MPRRCTDLQWRRAVRDVLVAADLPRDYHVDVRRVDKLEGALGYTSAVDEETGRYLIEVTADACHELTIWILIHEVAHVLDWGPPRSSREDHGPTWGCHFAAVWSRYHQTR